MMGIRIHRLLLYVYPRRFRRRYEDRLLEAFRSMFVDKPRLAARVLRHVDDRGAHLQAARRTMLVSRSASTAPAPASPNSWRCASTSAISPQINVIGTIMFLLALILVGAGGPGRRRDPA